MKREGFALVMIFLALSCGVVLTAATSGCNSTNAQKATAASNIAR
jgi:hypothetical protein